MFCLFVVFTPVFVPTFRLPLSLLFLLGEKPHPLEIFHHFPSINTSDLISQLFCTKELFLQSFKKNLILFSVIQNRSLSLPTTNPHPPDSFISIFFFSFVTISSIFYSINIIRARNHFLSIVVCLSQMLRI